VHLTKRLFDLLFAGLGVIFLSPVYLIITILVWLNLGAPVFFRQQRPGYKGKPFYIYKFRTMRSPVPGQSRTDEARMTRFGRWLRSTSLDELPELFNILKGEMSWVGPRPLLMEYLPLYNDEQSRRHDTLPGLTGWAQVNGRNVLSWQEKFALDVWYVDHWSFWLDLQIIWMTAWKVLKREGINQDGQATVEYFRGNE
jgi:lipopolysaccharide/colanic/teichoic acid biosynthesis glycosyltransferase